MHDFVTVYKPETAKSLFRTKCDLIVYLFKFQPFDGILFAHNTMNNIGYRFTHVVIRYLADNNVKAVIVRRIASTVNHHVKPLHRRSVKRMNI